MRPVFADPKTDFVFKRLFGSVKHKKLLIALLDALLELKGDHKIASVQFLRGESRPKVDGMKLSIVDVKCRDLRGTRYVVEMQVLNVEGFEKRVVYNAAKAYTAQLKAGEDYPALNDVVAVTICDFLLWPHQPDAPDVPLVSRWHMQEQHAGRLGLGQVQHVFLELPKLADRPPKTLVEKWAYFFRHAASLKSVPAPLAKGVFPEALDAARVASMTQEEWEAYERDGIARQDARGALSLARAEAKLEGKLEGKLEEKRAMLRRVVTRGGATLTPDQNARIDTCSDAAQLDRWIDAAMDGAAAGVVLAKA
jgi:predicted transposase/invertase (TIGR01784 family)